MDLERGRWEVFSLSLTKSDTASTSHTNIATKSLMRGRMSWGVVLCFLRFQRNINVHCGDCVLLLNSVTNQREGANVSIHIKISTRLASLWSSSFFFNCAVGRKLDKQHTISPQMQSFVLEGGYS